MIKIIKYISIVSYSIIFLNCTPNKTLSQENYNHYMLALVNGFINPSEELTEKIISLSDKNPIYNFNRTSLMLASFNGHINIVRKLLEYKADTKHIDDFGDTALIHASTGSAHTQGMTAHPPSDQRRTPRTDPATGPYRRKDGGAPLLRR